MARDVEGAEYHDFAKIQEGGICPHCGRPAITVSRGIEVGNIFQQGTKYTKSMNMTYVDANGEPKYPVMGCYGIGIGRLAASICEVHHDEYGPIWPLAVAPWQVHLCAVRSDEAEVRAGVIFSDADLPGVPIRVVVSPGNMEQNIVEIVARDKSFAVNVPIEIAAETILNHLLQLQGS